MIKKIDDSVHKTYYDRMHVRMQSGMMRLRSSTVEPVLGTLINFTGMRRINTRGISNVNKFMICAGIAYNLKKFIRFITCRRKSTFIPLENHMISTMHAVFSTIFSVAHTASL